MVDAYSRKIAGTAAFAKEVRAAANTVPAVVAALTEACGGVLAELVPWVLGHDKPAG
jgi:ABC-type uncharacterized transport system auxiliary subunit